MFKHLFWGEVPNGMGWASYSDVLSMIHGLPGVQSVSGDEIRDYLRNNAESNNINEEVDNSCPVPPPAPTAPQAAQNVGHCAPPEGGGDYSGGSFIRSGDVIVTFDANADNKVNISLSNYFKIIMSEASKYGIYSVNISCTTGHPSNASRSAHTIANGARALDINYINGTHVSGNDSNVGILQSIIKSTSGYMENYGPVIVEKVVNSMAIPAPWAREIPGGHYDHIHISVPKY